MTRSLRTLGTRDTGPLDPRGGHIQKGSILLSPWLGNPAAGCFSAGAGGAFSGEKTLTTLLKTRVELAGWPWAAC